jgi:hypothetical protein
VSKAPNNPEPGASPADDDDFNESLRDAVNDQLGEPRPMGKARKKPPPPQAAEPEQTKPKRRPKRKPWSRRGTSKLIVRYPRYRCPHCHSVNIRATKSFTFDNDVIERYTLCRECGKTSILILE